MDVQIGIIRYHTIADGMKYIIKLITLFHKFVLHEQTGLCLNPSFGFTSVGTHQPHNRSYQQCQDRRIEQYKKVFIFLPIRFVNDGSARGYFIGVNMKIIQLFIVIDESLCDFCHSYVLRGCTF